MRVLMITGDRHFKAGHPRFDLQASAVERLEALYWGPGTLWASPAGDSFEVVSTQDPFFRGLVGLVLAHRFRARLNVQLHADLNAQGFLKRLLARFVLTRADSIRVVSERIQKQIETFNVGRRASNITVLPVFVDVGRFRSVKRTPDAEPTILWVGRFEDEKDPLLALRVLREVRKKGINAKMVMLGRGALEARLKRAAAGLPVKFPGWQDTAPFLARAGVVLSTSRAESYGVSIVEALAAGVPVVAPDVGVAREAGAIVAEPGKLIETVVRTLQSPPSATLKLPLLSKDEWIEKWKEILT